MKPGTPTPRLTATVKHRSSWCTTQFSAARTEKLCARIRWGYQHSVYKKEFFAETREQALSMAARHFEVDPERLEVSELPLDVVGMGDRKCFVVSIEGTADQQPQEQPRQERGRREPRESRDRAPRDRESRGRRRDGDRGRGDRGDRGERGGGGDRGDRGRGGSRQRAPRGDRPEGVDHERLERQAKEAAEKVKSSGQPVTLPWMNSKERWVVHNYLKNVEGVTSVSEGEGAEKRLKVIPE